MGEIAVEQKWSIKIINENIVVGTNSTLVRLRGPNITPMEMTLIQAIELSSGIMDVIKHNKKLLQG